MSYGIRQEQGRPIKIKDEGLTLVSNVKSVDFTGDGVTGSAIGSDVTEEITGARQLAENDPILFDAANSADGKYSGLAIAGTAGATLAFGDLCYFNGNDSRWELVDANLSDGYDALLGMCVLAGNDGDATRMLLIGNIRADTAFPALTIGKPVYMGEVAGDVVTTAPTTADVCVRIIGYSLTNDELYFSPEKTVVIHT